MPFIFQGNILIDKTCHARIADFGFTILSDSMIPNLGAQGGTVRWMSPELLDSGAQDRQPTKYSDCYALGMVIYEVISLCVPFYQYQNSVIPGKVVQGDRPERPKGVDGVRFTNDVWEMLERCWAHKLGNRPRIEDVLQCLERGSVSWGLLPRSLSVIHSAPGPLTSFQTKILLQARMRVGYLPPLEQHRLGLQRNLTEGISQKHPKRYVGEVFPTVLVLT